MGISSHNQESASTWESYRQKHGWRRIEDFPEGITPPHKVRLYRQNGYFRLQWWDPREKRNLTDRVDGDLIAAISRAREVDEQILHYRSGGARNRRIRHSELIDQFCTDLRRRADSGEIKPATSKRYASALTHYANFCVQSQINSRYPSATQVDREFALEFQAWLQNLEISSNGHENTPKRPLSGIDYVLDVVRALFEWAADPDRGNLMPVGFRNPFKGRRVNTRESAPDLFGEPDITIAMAAEFLESCDEFLFPLFSLYILCGLRASEPCYLMWENITNDGWFKVISLPNLGYTTKGRRDKRFPLLACLRSLLDGWSGQRHRGLLFRHRNLETVNATAPLLSASLSELETAYEQRCRQLKTPSAEQRESVRDQIIKDAGGLSYDTIEHEFRRIARRLNWDSSATLKDFRHLFSTELMNAGVPDYYRKYLMGQAVSKSALTNYTHLNELREWYQNAVNQRFAPILDLIRQRVEE